MPVYALIENGTVVNMVEWDGIAPWHAPGGQTAVAATANAMIGGTYANGTFTAAPAPAPLS
jgi:hypothetical protein